MCSPICPKIFAKLDYFVTVSQMGVAYFVLKIFWAFLTFSQFCLANPVLKILENRKKNPNPHFLGSGPRETGKLNQTDGDKGLPKCGIYIGVTPCKKLGNMKKQQKHTDWVL